MKLAVRTLLVALIIAGGIFGLSRLGTLSGTRDGRAGDDVAHRVGQPDTARAADQEVGPANAAPDGIQSSPATDRVETDVAAGDVASAGSGKSVAEAAGSAVRIKSRELVVPENRQEALQALSAIPRGERSSVFVQLERTLDASGREALNAAGVGLREYVGNETWLASAEGGAESSPVVQENVKASWPVLPEDRTAAALRTGEVPAHAVAPNGDLRLNILAVSGTDLGELAQEVLSAGGSVDEVLDPFDMILATVPPAQLQQIASLDGVHWMEPIAPAPGSEMNRARAYLNQTPLPAAPYLLSGSGVEVSVHDFGHVRNHPDLAGRWVQGDAGAGQTLNVLIHPSMTGGTIAGDGTGNANYAGMASGATVVTYSYESTPCCEANNYADIQLELQRGVDVANNSWGYFCGSLPFGDYTTQARVFDRQVLGMNSVGTAIGDPEVVVFSGGNERDGAGDDGSTACITNTTAPWANYGTVNQPKPSKNPIVVGAVDSANDRMSSFSSWGPVSDGRLRPDLVAAGVHNGTNSAGVSVIDNCFGSPTGASNQQCYRTTNSDNTFGGYAWFSQTSAAAAMVSGISALFIEDFRSEAGGADPLPSTVKAHLIHTADDLDDTTSWYNRGPDYASGYGVVDAQAAIDQLRSGGWLEDCVDQGEVDTLALNVPGGTTEVKVTLVWDDVPSSPATTAPALVNDLDLVVTDSGGTRRYPWTLDPASPSADAVRTAEDHLNNVEVVEVDAGVPDGSWTVDVAGTNVPSGPQCYSLVYSPVGGAVAAPCDVNADGQVDRSDVSMIFGDRGTAASGPDDPRDADGDGNITVNDARACVLECTNPNCAS